MSFFEFVKVHFIPICSIISITFMIYHKNIDDKDYDSDCSNASTVNDELLQKTWTDSEYLEEKGMINM